MYYWNKKYPIQESRWGTPLKFDLGCGDDCGMVHVTMETLGRWYALGTFVKMTTVWTVPRLFSPLYRLVMLKILLISVNWYICFYTIQPRKWVDVEINVSNKVCHCHRVLLELWQQLWSYRHLAMIENHYQVMQVSTLYLSSASGRLSWLWSKQNKMKVKQFVQYICVIN